MGHVNYLKILWIVLFLGLSAFSCTLTEESLHLLWPNLSPAFRWLLVVSLFVMASIGGTLIIDSFSKKPSSYFAQTFNISRHRTFALLFGVVIMIVCWLITSMPTNTHTLLYRNRITDVALNDIKTTQEYLKQLMTTDITAQKVQTRQLELRNDVNADLRNLNSEIHDPNNLGLGPKADSVLNVIGGKVGKFIQRPKWDNSNSRSREKRNQLYSELERRILELLSFKCQAIEDEFKREAQQREKCKDEATKKYNNLGSWKNALDEGRFSFSDADAVTGNSGLNKLLSDGYTTIKSHSTLIDFKDESDKQLYTADEPVTRVSRILSVLDLWKDLLTGNMPNTLLMVFFIIISIVVDLAAFVFFYLAQK